MKKSASILSAGIIVLAFVLILRSAFSLTKEPEDTVVGVSASWSKGYDTVEQMEEASDIIISGRIKHSEPEVRENLVFTMNHIEVLSVHKGSNISVGDTIKLLQTGGTFKGKTTVAFSEIPLLQEEVEYLLFLYKSPADKIYEEYYLIMGGFQGVASKTMEGSYQALSSANSKFIEDSADRFAAITTQTNKAEKEVLQ